MGKKKKIKDPRDDPNWDHMGELRAGMNAVFNGGPSTFNGQPILGLYDANIDPFLKANPTIKPFEQFEAETLVEWWGVDWNDNNLKYDDDDDSAIPNKKYPIGTKFDITYWGDGGFRMTGGGSGTALSHPVSLGGKKAVLKGKVDDSIDIKYNIHFKKV